MLRGSTVNTVKITDKNFFIASSPFSFAPISFGGYFLLHRKLRDPYAAVLQCLVTDMDQIGGRKGCLCLLFYYK